jgi:GTP-binding protein
VTSAEKKMGRDKMLQFIEDCNKQVAEAGNNEGNIG